MTGWKRNDELKAPATILQKMPIADHVRAEQLRAQADWLAARGQHEAADILRDEAGSLT